MDLHLKNRITLVTGGSRGIGRAIALRLAEEGSDVAICGRGQADLDRALGELREKDIRAHGQTADALVEGQMARFVDDSAEALGGVDCLVANVGGGAGDDSKGLDGWRKTFELNAFHAVEAIRAAAPHMRRRGGGSIVIIASISGWKAQPGSYGAAKAAEIFMAGAFALELAADRIRVNTLSPGSILFPGGGWEKCQQEKPQEFEGFVRNEFPWGRLGTAEEIADVAAFLLSDRANWINGAHIPVDGLQGRPSAWRPSGIH
jgi:3-oxoacyl-[acyl-carrier protein] reductase